MNTVRLVVLATLSLVVETRSALATGWEHHVVQAAWLFPNAHTVLETHDVVVGSGIELPATSITSDSKFSIDLGPDTVQFNFNATSNWTVMSFNGWSFSDPDGTIPAITGYSLDAVSAGVGNIGSIVTSFDADHVKANFAGLAVAGNDNFIRLKVSFASPWTDLASGLAGSSGVPSLVGTGSLLASTSATLELTAANPSSLSDLFISMTSLPAPFKGGMLVPVPVGETIVGVTDAAGAIALTIGHWPGGVPSGSTFYMQYAIQDAAGPQGASLSNALEAVTP